MATPHGKSEKYLNDLRPCTIFVFDCSLGRRTQCTQTGLKVALSTIQRHSFTAQQKLKIVAVDKEVGNSEAGRLHNGDESHAAVEEEQKSL